MWIILAVLSALFLGFYDVCKKRSLDGNSVVGVLTISILISCVLLTPMLLLSNVCAEVMRETLFYVPRIGLRVHLCIFIKSCIVLSSWVCAYMAVKHLPLSVVSPLQATRPMWTLLGAIVLFGETLNSYQWAGVVCALGSIFLFSLVERHSEESKTVRRSYYVYLAGAILLGAASGLYDKYMMRRFDHNAVQVYYTYYQSIMMLVVWGVVSWRKKRSKGQVRSTFHWRWEIAGISLFLVLSDFVYLLALTYPDSLIAVVSTTRRGGMVIPFVYGLLFLREKDPKKKVLCLAGVLTGLIFLLLGSL